MLDLLGELLYRLRDFCLKPPLEEHREGDENHKIEHKQKQLEVYQIGLDESLQVVFD